MANTTEKMERGAAEKEVTAWLDYKNVKESLRTAYKAQIETLIEAFRFGLVTMNADTFEITHKLDLPVKELDLSELVFKPRMTIGDMRKASANIKPTDFDGKCVAYIAALTGKGMSHIDKMDSADYNIGQAIVVFFM